MNNTPIGIATIRGLIGAALIGASTFFAVWATFDTPPWKPVLVASGSAAVAALSARLGEGLNDQRSSVQREADREKSGGGL